MSSSNYGAGSNSNNDNRRMSRYGAFNLNTHKTQGALENKRITSNLDESFKIGLNEFDSR